MLLCLYDDRKRIEIAIPCHMHEVGKQVDEVTCGTSMGAAQFRVCLNGSLSALQRCAQIVHRDSPSRLLDNAQAIASRPNVQITLGLWPEGNRLDVTLVDCRRPERSAWPKAWDRGAVGGWLENQADVLPDRERIELAIDEVRHHGWAFREHHIADGVGWRGAAHDAVAVDCAIARGLFPGGLAKAERAERARIPMRLAARPAPADQEPALLGGFE